MDCSLPGLPVPHRLLEFAQIQVHCIGDADSILVCQNLNNLKQSFCGNLPEDPFAKQPIHETYHVYQLTSQRTQYLFKELDVKSAIEIPRPPSRWSAGVSSTSCYKSSFLDTEATSLSFNLAVCSVAQLCTGP